MKRGNTAGLCAKKECKLKRNNANPRQMQNLHELSVVFFPLQFDIYSKWKRKLILSFKISVLLEDITVRTVSCVCSK